MVGFTGSIQERFGRSMLARDALWYLIQICRRQRRPPAGSFHATERKADRTSSTCQMIVSYRPSWRGIIAQIAKPITVSLTLSVVVLILYRRQFYILSIPDLS